MSRDFRSWGVALAGLATSIFTAVVVTLIDHFLNLNIFTFSIWGIIPAGAGICGFAAASGYYLAAKGLHQRPTKILLLQMVVIAAFSQLLIYYLEYATLTIDGKAVSDFVSFGRYLDISLTKTHYKIGRALQSDLGEVGDFSYWLAGFQFFGFLIGGAFLYMKLKDQPACDDCGKYLRVS